MDDLPSDFKPEKKRNTKAIILIVAVIAIISFAVYSSYNIKYVDESYGNLHATISKKIELTSGRLDGSLINDGKISWDINSVNIVGGDITCFRMPKDVGVNETVFIGDMYCTGRNIEDGASYSILIYINDVDDESVKFLITATVQN